MGRLLLVAATGDVEDRLRAAVGSDACVSVDLTGLRDALPDADAVVIGTEAPAPLAAVQWVHRAEPACGVVVLTTSATDEEVRRTSMYAPDMPVSLTVVEAGSADLEDRVLEVVEASRLRRAHQEMLSAVAARETDQPASHGLAPASLGALLDHAPFGVLVGALDGRLLSWNRWAGDLLGLPNDVAGKPLPSLFPSSEYLEEAFALARQGRLGEGTDASTFEVPGDRAVQVSTAPTRLEDGEEAVLVMVQDITARRQAERTRDRLAEHVGLLGRVSEALSGTLDVEAALRRLADQVVPGFADWVSMQTYDERGQSRRVVVRHRDRALESSVETVRQGLMSGLSPSSPSRRVVETGAPVLLPVVTEKDLAEFIPDTLTRGVVSRLGVASVISVPLPGRDEVRGSMSLVRTADSPAYTSEDLAVGVEVGRRAGVALDTISLYARQRDLAAELQRSLLTAPPQSREAEVEVRYVAAAEEAQVGGDWYDAFVQPDGSTVLVIGDVMGHDNRAAAAMGQLRALLRGIGYTSGTGPAEMLSRLDAAIEGLSVETTATGLVVRLEPRDDDATGPATFCWSNAGHPPAIAVPPGGGATVLDDGDPDLLLGVLAHTERRQSRATLVPGGTLLLYTDGLIERRGQSIDEGLATLTAAVDRFSDQPLAMLCDRVLAELLPEKLDDDVALVAVRLRTPDELEDVPQ